jgi:hypothetical protein
MLSTVSLPPRPLPPPTPQDPVACPHCLQLAGYCAADLYEHLVIAHQLPKRESREVALCHTAQRKET